MAVTEHRGTRLIEGAQILMKYMEPGDLFPWGAEHDVIYFYVEHSATSAEDRAALKSADGTTARAAAGPSSRSTHPKEALRRRGDETMGLYDTLRCNDPRFVCSEGHSLAEEEFQTKDLGETMGYGFIEGGVLTFVEGAFGIASLTPVTEHLEIYCTCRKCPAFVQAKTLNLVDCSVVFEVDVGEAKVLSVTRTSSSTAEWLESEPKQPWMKDCRGPMSYEDAQREHCAWRPPREEQP